MYQSWGGQDTLRNSLLILLLIVSVISIVWFVFREHTDRVWILIFFIISLVITMLMCAFTTTDSVWRYYFMSWYVISFAVGLLVDALLAGIGEPQQAELPQVKRAEAVRELQTTQLRRLAAYGMAGIILLYSVLAWRAELLPILRTPVYNAEYAQIVSWMQEHDYYYGYSTYETSNALTGYANGAVQVSAVADLGQMDICKWLTDRTWYGPYVPEDTKTAYIIPTSLEDAFTPMREAHAEIELALETTNYKVYVSPVNYSWQ